MNPIAAILPDGQRLHLQHGPIDLIVGADGNRLGAFQAAKSRFQTILQEIVDELPLLRSVPGEKTPVSETPFRMFDAAHSFAEIGFVTPMAGVAGAVAETILAAMVENAELSRAYVNNGGDIALHLTPGTRFSAAVSRHDGRVLGQVKVTHDMPVRGIATSARHGRSMSLGIADCVTVLAETASVADVSATMIANKVDLPGHPSIRRRPAHEIDEDSDLGERPVVTKVGKLTHDEVKCALGRGAVFAQECLYTKPIQGVMLVLGDQIQSVGHGATPIEKRAKTYA